MARHRVSRHTIGVPRVLWQAVFFIRTTYSDRICYRPGVMIASVVCFSSKEVRIGERAAIPPGCLTSGTFHPDISHLAPDAKWERRAFQIPRSDIYPDPLITLTRRPTDILRYFATQCHGVLLKLLDMSNRHFEIFFYTVPRCSPEASRYLPPTKLDFFSRYFV